jgi:hypothetical protein
MLDNYKMYRVNFFCLWALINIIFVVQIESIMESSDTIALNDGSLNVLQCFSILLALQALFRVFFGALHICRIKATMNSKQYKVQHQDLSKVVDTMKGKGQLEDSTY